MAWTVGRNKVTVFGDMRTVILSLSADAATQTIETGLKTIVGFASGEKSLSTAGVKMYANSNASGVQSMGVLGCSGFVSGDELFVVVFGN